MGHIKTSLILLLLRISNKDGDELFLYLILIPGHIKHHLLLFCALVTEETFLSESCCDSTTVRPVP